MALTLASNVHAFSVSKPTPRTYKASINLISTFEDHHVQESENNSPTQSQAYFLAPAMMIALFFSFAPLSDAIEGDIGRGQVLFSASCNGCHAGGQNFIKEKKNLKKDALEKFVGLDEESIQTFFKGSSQHKRIGVKFTDQEIADASAFVVDQAKGDKW